MAEAEWQNGGGENKDIFTAIIIGECGQGKSTVTYNLRLRPQLLAPMDGVAANGVTKEFIPYKVDLCGSGRKECRALDSPGIGDGDVNLIQWVSLCEKAFKEVNAIIVCVSECNPRITLGAELVTNLVNKGFLGDVQKIKADKEAYAVLCDSIVVVGTQGNLAGPRLRNAMPTTVETFAKKCGLPRVPYVSCPAAPNWVDDGKSTPVLDVSALHKHLAKLKGMVDVMEAKGTKQKDVVKYTQIEETTLVEIVCRASGVEISEEVKRKMAEELGFLRNFLYGTSGLFSLKYEERQAALKRCHTAFKTAMDNLTAVWTEMENFCVRR